MKVRETSVLVYEKVEVVQEQSETRERRLGQRRARYRA